MLNVFEPGWTQAAISDNYVARFESLIPAQWVRIKATALDKAGHDGTAQIDAIMAVPTRVKTLVALHFDVEEAIIGDPQTDQIRYAAQLPGDTPANTTRTRLSIVNAADLSGPAPVAISVSAVAADSGGTSGPGERTDIAVSFVPSTQVPTAPERIGVAMQIDLRSFADNYGTLTPRFDGSLFDVREPDDGGFFEVLFSVDGLLGDRQHFSIFGSIDNELFRFQDVNTISFEELPGEFLSLFGLIIELEAIDPALLGSGMGSQSLLSSQSIQSLFHLEIGGAQAVPEPGLFGSLGAILLMRTMSRRRRRA